MDSEMEKSSGRSSGGTGVLFYGSSDSNEPPAKSSGPSAETGMIIGLVFAAVVIMAACGYFYEEVYCKHRKLHPNDTFIMIFKHLLGMDIDTIQK